MTTRAGCSLAFEELGAAQSASSDLAGLGIHPVHLHHLLCDVCRISRTIHFGASVSSGCVTTPLWHSMPLTARPPFPTGASVVVGAPFPLAGRAGGWVGG